MTVIFNIVGVDSSCARGHSRCVTIDSKCVIVGFDKINANSTWTTVNSDYVTNKVVVQWSGVLGWNLLAVIVNGSSPGLPPCFSVVCQVWLDCCS